MKQLTDDQDIDATDVSVVDLSLANMKEICASWIVEAAKYIQDNPSLIVSGFCHSGITGAVDEAYGHLQSWHLSEDENEAESDDYSIDDNSDNHESSEEDDDLI